MTRPFTILIDLDSTVYDLTGPTLDWINETHKLNLKPLDIKTWDWNKEYNVDPYGFWNQEGTFLNLKPFPHATTAIRKVHEWGIRQVFFSTIVTKHGAWEKFAAVDRDFPFIGRKNTLFTGGLKDLAYGDMLIDDGPHNLMDFTAAGGLSVLADLYGAPYCKANSPIIDVMTDWKQYPEIVLGVLQARQKPMWSGENAG